MCGTAGAWAYLFLDRAPRPHGESRLEGGILSAVVAGAIGGMLVLNVLRPPSLSEPRVQAFWASEFGMGVGAGLVWLVGWLGSRVFRKEAMGFGDVKLMGLLGAVVGWTGVLRGFFVACLLGSVIGVFVLVRHRSHYVPFGPFLSVGCYSLLLWPEAFESAVRWYLGLFGGVPG
jgi:prepilin signal peptidase PulO-like enzyme (type II secretory pathway)